MITLVPFSHDPLAVAAEQILNRYQEQLPDLSQCQVLVAEDRCAPQLRAELLRQAEQRGAQALLGPCIETLDSWLNRVSCVADNVLNRPAQELVLAEALRNASEIYGDTDPWLLADQLLSLFDELTRSDGAIVDDLESFQRKLQQSYGIQKPDASLQREAYILHTLWHAWHQQLRAGRLLDPASAYRQQIQSSAANPGQQTLWLIGFTEFSPVEAVWLRQLLDQHQAHLILHGTAQQQGYHPDAPISEILQQLDAADVEQTAAADDSFGAFIGALFEVSPDNLKQRAARFRREQPDDPVGTRVNVLQAEHPEQEAQAVALQIRRWLLDDVQPIAIVSEDRRLARRVRALLEGSHIELDDSGGWALSTTSAAATLERWLETVEEDFACAPLLDVLKSPFVNFSDRDSHLMLVRRFEQDIVLHENIARGLERYRHHLNLRSERLPDWSEPMRRALQQMLNTLDHAASSLLPLMNGSYPAHEFLVALNNSLSELGIRQCLQSDAAGQQLLDVVEELQQASRHSDVHISWSEFRNWLGRNLERSTFRPPWGASPVQLLTLEQSRLQRFAAVIVAGCSRDHLPGKPASHAFFNQRVRSELGLPTWSRAIARKLHHFCRVLHSADRVLLTWPASRDSEPLSASPWIELLEAFYQNAYQGKLGDLSLRTLLDQPGTRPATPDNAALPLQAARPAPQMPVSVQPKTWSAYTHQRLIDCPYRFFAADALALKPREEIREALSKSDYGSLVHRIAQAFNSSVPGLPGPWSGALDSGSRQQALQLLTQISNKVFAEAVENDFQARSWLKQWLTVLPDYLEWEIARHAAWQLHEVELKAERDISSTLRIKGRIDRVDQRNGAMALVDYKTGTPPRTEDVVDGEAVQLPTYALLLQHSACQLDYLEFTKDRVKPRTCAEGETLDQLLKDVEQRLVELDSALQQGARLPAWGDPAVCGYCEFDGMCRRDMWSQGEAQNV